MSSNCPPNIHVKIHRRVLCSAFRGVSSHMGLVQRLSAGWKAQSSIDISITRFPKAQRTSWKKGWKECRSQGMVSFWLHKDIVWTWWALLNSRTHCYLHKAWTRLCLSTFHHGWGRSWWDPTLLWGSIDNEAMNHCWEEGGHFLPWCSH